ncbi:MAG: ribose-5-phosphate isomerase RpiA [Lactobacillales bacterium]|jgi:ribose 5-phosphate isomerase A|nr:ribose-5-phosphate isomerase RpiA [Lactobacillales bacterium]
MNLKEVAGIKAASYVEDGMIVGLGTGSTVHFTTVELARRVREEGLKIIGVPTSEDTRVKASGLGIELKTVDEVDHIDVTIDGSDEVCSHNDTYYGIKGGGAALLFEKIVAINSHKNIWVVGEDKCAEEAEFGKFPLPVEVVKYGSVKVFEKLAERGYNPTFRLNNDNEKLTTDNGGYIIDLHLGVIENPPALAKELKEMVGVVEHGLFLGTTDVVIVGTEEGAKIWR